MRTLRVILALALAVVLTSPLLAEDKKKCTQGNVPITVAICGWIS